MIVRPRDSSLNLGFVAILLLFAAFQGNLKRKRWLLSIKTFVG